MIRRIVDSNLLDLDFDDVAEQPGGRTSSSSTATVPNFSILSSATTGNIQTLAGEPEAAQVSSVHHGAGASAAPISSTATTCFHNMRSNGQVPTLSDSDLDLGDDDMDCGGTDDDDMEGVLNPDKLQELAHLLSMFSPHLNELTQHQRAMEASADMWNPNNELGIPGSAGQIPPHVCPMHPHNHVHPPAPVKGKQQKKAAVPSPAPPTSSSSKNRKKKKNNNGASAAPVASRNGGGAAAAASSSSMGSMSSGGNKSGQQQIGNHVWISAASCHGDDNSGVNGVFKEMEGQILPFLKNTYVSEYRFPHKLSRAEKNALKRIAHERDLDCITVDEGKERYVALKKRPPKELSPCEVEMTIDQLEKQARKTLSLVKMLTEKRSSGPYAQGNGTPHVHQPGVCNHGPVHDAASAPVTVPKPVAAVQPQKPATVKTVAATTAVTKSGGNDSAHEISIQANAHDMPGKKRMIDVGLQTCPEGWYVCQYCEQDIPETEQVSHRSACLAEHRERIVQKAAEADRRRARRRRRQLRDPNDPEQVAGTEAESEARARLSRIHGNDLDSLLKTVQQMDTKCNAKGCSAKAQPCRECRHPFCPEHLRHHGCSGVGVTMIAAATGNSGASTSTGVGVSTGTDMEGATAEPVQHHRPAHSDLTYFERSQLRRNWKQKVTALQERRK